MKVTKKEFQKLNTQDKILNLIDYTKKQLITNKCIENAMYVFDNKGKMYSFLTQDSKLFEEEAFKKVLNKLIIKKLNKLKEKNKTEIDSILTLYYTPFDMSVSKNSIDLEEDLNKDYHFISIHESVFNIELKVFDTITSKDSKSNTEYIIMANNPTLEYKYSKLDVDDSIKGTLINLF